MSAQAGGPGLPILGTPDGMAATPGGGATGAGGPAPVRIVVAYGFWIFLLSDIILFSALFASYAVLSGQTAGGPSGRELFALRHVGIETVCLLFSSYTCGLGILAIERRRLTGFYWCFALTFVLGATFLGLELSEFAGMVARGAGPSRSAFLSAFFSLVGLHGAHVTAGLLWLTFMVAQAAVKGPRDFVRRRLLCFSLFWHALDIIWVGLLTMVYLMGAR
jgi:cytochrome o ubiquinol oxidase subunit 3